MDPLRDVVDCLRFAFNFAQGCSQSIVANDDHHWVEFWDPSAEGPFGDYWHTKEGVSNGNSGGPWVWNFSLVEGLKVSRMHLPGQ